MAAMENLGREYEDRLFLKGLTSVGRKKRKARDQAKYGLSGMPSVSKYNKPALKAPGLLGSLYHLTADTPLMEIEKMRGKARG